MCFINRIIRLIVFVVMVSVPISYKIYSEEMSALFSLEVKNVSENMNRRYLPVEVKVTYIGEEPLTLWLIEGCLLSTNRPPYYLPIDAEAPHNWEMRQVPLFFSLNQLIGKVTLAPGYSEVATFDLRKIFKQIPAGTSELLISFSISEPDNPYQIKLQTPLTTVILVDEDDESFSAFVSEARETIKNENDYRKKISLYESFMWLDDPIAVPILFDALIEARTNWFDSDKFQRRVYQVSHERNSFLQLVQYLQLFGTDKDAKYFFELFKRDKISFSVKERELLYKSFNPWIRIHAYDLFAGENAPNDFKTTQSKELDLLKNLLEK